MSETSSPEPDLKQLAIDIHAGRVFTDRHLRRDARDLLLVFMPIGFMGHEDRAQMIADMESGAIGMLYEYMREAGPRSINGLPSFFSVRMLNREQADTTWRLVGEIETAVAGVTA